ncbi:unnamed protein product [Pleuronectes platessa]|uniref:Uncharacterized protein n=1 Tax=Pleuronectes platessa TaxID=8262 RepID=A0A9N7V4N4_PLEPL|nr:unnamed protein product [Pleuronectes platessa]
MNKWLKSCQHDSLTQLLCPLVSWFHPWQRSGVGLAHPCGPGLHRPTQARSPGNRLCRLFQEPPLPQTQEEHRKTPKPGLIDHSRGPDRGGAKHRENMAGPHSINQTTPRLPKPN